MRKALGSLRALKTFSAVGVIAASVLAVNANVLVARFYKRWDLTSDRLYTLSDATRSTLRDLKQPVRVVVLLSRGDPLLSGVRELLVAYRAETTQLSSEFIDPAQHPAEFLAIQQKYDISAGRAEDGRVLTDAALIVTQGERHWFVTADELVSFDADSGSARPRIERALTSGIVNVLGLEKAKICFTRGHQEAGLNDAGPEGLVELRNRVEKSNYLAEERDLPQSAAGAPFEGCRLVIVAGPRLPFEAADSAALTQAIQAGTSALVLSSPIVGEPGTIKSSGLEPLAALAGAELGRDLVIETDSAARLPRGIGEIFFATPREHAVTAGLLKGGAKVELRVLVSEASSLRLASNEAKVLLTSSEESFVIDDVRPLLDGRMDSSQTPRKSQILAVARELAKPSGASHAPRIVFAAAANLAHNRNFRDSGLYGDRILVENAVSWLAARPALVSVPEKPPHEVGLALSEESLSEVMRYVLIYMPGSAALVGVAVILRRRSVEKRSRQSSQSRRGDDEARA
ncbi:MAG: DUF7088 domain-containing protein [Myxococcota bacterium]